MKLSLSVKLLFIVSQWIAIASWSFLLPEVCKLFPMVVWKYFTTIPMIGCLLGAGFDGFWHSVSEGRNLYLIRSRIQILHYQFVWYIDCWFKLKPNKFCRQLGDNVLTADEAYYQCEKLPVYAKKTSTAKFSWAAQTGTQSKAVISYHKLS